MDRKPKIYTGGLVVTRAEGEAIFLRVGAVEIRVDVREVMGKRVRIGVLADADLVEIRRDDAVRPKAQIQ
jgi:sRNA-binding carbon storage regulator CsrA